MKAARLTPRQADIIAFAGKNVLVSGGAGFIGSHLAEALTRSNASVTVVDNLSTGSLENFREFAVRPRVIVGDVRRASTLQKARKTEVVFHLAALALSQSFRDPVLNCEVNVGGTVNALEHARKWDSSLVFASSGSVYGLPKTIPIAESQEPVPASPYGVSKLAAEEYVAHYVRQYGIRACSLRYFNVFGPRQKVGEEMGVVPIFVRNAMLGATLRIFGDGKQTRDFLYVSDVVNGTMLAALRMEEAKGMRLNIGGPGKEVSILQLASMVGSIVGRPINIQHAEAKPGDIARLVADSSLARKLIGYKARVSLREGLREYVRWLDQHS